MDTSCTYQFTPCQTKDGGITYLPLIRLTIIHKGIKMPFLGLIDSGANDCCFPGSIARDLGHDLEKGKERIFEGVGGEVKTYLHQNYIQIQDVRIRGDLYFSDEWNDWGFGL